MYEKTIARTKKYVEIKVVYVKKLISDIFLSLENIASNNELTIFENFCSRGKLRNANYYNCIQMRTAWETWGVACQRLNNRVCPSVRLSVHLSVCSSVCLSAHLLQLMNPGLECSHWDRKTKIAGDMYFDVLFHMRSILTPRNVLPPLPFLGFEPPFYFFKLTIELQRSHEIHRNKICWSQKVDNRYFFFLSQYNISSNNELTIFKTLICAENEGTRIMYSKGGPVGSPGMTIFFIDTDNTREV